MSFARYSTDGRPAQDRAGHWHGVIAEAYFPLRLSFRDAGTFAGSLEMRTLEHWLLQGPRLLILLLAPRKRREVVAAPRVLATENPSVAPVVCPCGCGGLQRSGRLH